MKKGQVTAFIIFGMVILALGITVYTFRAQILSATFGTELEENIVVPPQAERAKLYVDTCLESITLQGLQILGAQAGYINPPNDQIPNIVSPFGSSLDLFSNGGSQVPFWFTETENGLQKNQIPTKAQMESALARYILDNLASCLNDFKPLRNQGYALDGEPEQMQTFI